GPAVRVRPGAAECDRAGDPSRVPGVAGRRRPHGAAAVDRPPPRRSGRRGGASAGSSPGGPAPPGSAPPAGRAGGAAGPWGAGGARRWQELGRQGEAVGLVRVAGRVAVLGAALGSKSHTLSWDAQSAGRALLELTVLVRMAQDLAS